MSERKRVAIFVKGDTPDAAEASRAKCEAWAQKRGYEVVAHYEGKGRMDVLLDVMNDISRRKFDVLVAAKTTEFGRLARPVRALVQRADKHGVVVSLVGAKEDLTTPIGQQILALQVAEDDAVEGR
ncbi:recombinase family protein [Streptomyces sp. RTd22]|uniref:recombinase family protein n=1 Tax=Streptomyces sp. RTd22 TaxID=1841249 RepID=UPI0007C5D05B|nr:recombinase family protein [Streptomyces sp. RTd22]